ncbi:hypothetical protein [Telmatospirillum siberiense]|uniref:Uncharacterized protein n=1 Tax=Telmatospirillum siberiense TaxID=382514 RepID=A0A2N3PUP1_9PROT|nr:hypothetical protein [Telmatospirillum siberiense]PKU24116.1 hypothetical protein CWS72_13555 [Telmatospirillum siberiense]
MRTRFPRGSTAYAKDGRSYIVEEVADGIVYCTTSNGTETEFPESKLMNAAEWEAATKVGLRREVSYLRMRQSPHFLPAGGTSDEAAADRLLVKADHISPGILDFAAFTVAERILAERKEEDLAGQLSVRKCREMFDAAPPSVRARLLAHLLGARPDALVSAGGLGENLLKAMVAKGLEPLQAAYEAFQDRPHR